MWMNPNQTTNLIEKVTKVKWEGYYQYILKTSGYKMDATLA